MIWLAADARHHPVVRRAAVLWIALLVVYAVSVGRFMPTYLLPLMAVVAGVCLSTPDRDRNSAVYGTVCVAILFSLFCLSPKVMLANGFLTQTSYGRAAHAIQSQHVSAVPLSETALDPTEGYRVAHFWMPRTIAAVRDALDHPNGWYVLSDDSVIKATVTPYGLGLRGMERLPGDYLRFVDAFRSAFADRIVFAEQHPFEAEQRFFEIHTGGYWPWRYVLAILRDEEIAPGTSVVVYRIPPAS